MHKDIEFFTQRLYRVVRILPQLLAVFNLGLEQLTQLFVVVLQLFVTQGFTQDVLAVRQRGYALVHVGRLSLLRRALFAVLFLGLSVLTHVSTGATGRLLADGLSEVVQDESPQILNILNVLHEGFVVFLHHVLTFLLASQNIFHVAEGELFGAVHLQSDADFGITILGQQLLESAVLQLLERHHGEQLEVLLEWLAGRHIRTVNVLAQIGH